MKIVIQSNCGPYALSRREVESICSSIPSDIKLKIEQLMLVKNKWGFEPFEYDVKNRIAYFAFPDDKNIKNIKKVARYELLLGFARIEANDNFIIRLSEKQRERYRDWIRNHIEKTDK